MANIDYVAYIQAILNIASAATPMKVECGILPPATGVSAVAAGGTVKHYMGGDALLRLLISLNVKADTQDAGCLNALADVHTALLIATLHDDAAWQMTGISIKSPPMYMGPDTTGMHLYGSSIEARIYVKG